MRMDACKKSLLISLGLALLCSQAAWASGDSDPGGGGPGARTAGQNFFRDEYAVNVDPTAGAFSTRVEIRVPKYHGLEPKLALQYSSSAGNGFVGVGWKLEGISYIERITPNGGSPTYVDATDTFALDGEELLPCNFGGSGNYCTRVHSFQKIVRNGANWEITTKDGIKSVYEPLINGTTGKTFRWAISTVTDRQATPNQVTYEYQCPATTSDCYPWFIRYNNDKIQILFEREGRNDDTSYTTGVGVRAIDARLSGILIELFEQDDIIRHYMLTYKSIGAAGAWSLLEKVQHLGTNDDFGDRLPELVYDYEVDTSIVFERDEDAITLNAGGEFLSGDYNGDQRTDLLYLPPGSATTNRKVYLLTARTDMSSGNFTMTEESVPNVPTYPQLHDGDWLQGDFNRDGLSDLAHAHDNGNPLSSTNLWLWFRQPNGTFDKDPADASLAEADALNKGFGRWIAGDWNGDGRTDLLHASAQNNKVYVWLMDGDLTVPVSVLATISNAHQGWWLPADVDGDGNTDIVNIRNATITTWRSRGDGTFDPSDAYNIPVGYPEPFINGVWRTGDLNGDGKTDLVHFGDDPQIQVLYRTADATPVYDWESIAVPTSPSPYPYTADGWWFTAEINGDGITDFYNVVNDQTLRIWRSNGSAHSYTHSTEDPPSGYPPLWASPSVETIKWASGDFDGNGRDDLVHVVQTFGVHEIWAWTADNQVSAPASPNQLNGRLKSIKNRTGGTTTLTYQPSSAPNVDNDYLPVGMVMHPVKTLVTNNGLSPATTHTTTYQFEKGLWSSDERCFLGFEVSRRFHEAAGTAGSYEETTLDRDVANCINPASRVAQKAPFGTAGVYTDDRFFSFTDFVHEIDTTRPYQALEQERVVNECNLTSNLSNCRKVETETQYDQYANVTRVVERGDIGFTGDERTTLTTFAYNTSAFIVDRPSQEAVYPGAFTGSTGSTTAAADTLFSYDNLAQGAAPTRGNLTEREVWDSSVSAYRKTGFGYDNWGNVTSEVSPRGYAEGNVAAFTTTTTYETTFRVFPDIICRPTGKCVDQDWQARREVLTQEVDLANNLTTTYDYDIFGRLRFVHHPDGTQTEYDYWDVGTAVADQFIYISVPDDTPDGLTQQVYLDGFAREWKVVKEGGARQLTTYHENSERIATQSRWHLTSESSNATTFVYDGAKRVSEVHEPGRTHPIRRFYELLASPAVGGAALKPVVREQDHLQEEKFTWLDAYGRVSAVRETVVGGTFDTKFTYDTLDNLDIVTDALGNTADYDFDSLSRKTYVCDFDLGCWDFVHDANGNVVSQTDARGVVTASAYDALDRIGTRNNADGLTTWTYDEAGHGFSQGKLTSVSYPGGSESYSWDNMGFQTGVTRCVLGNCQPLGQVFTKSRLDTLTYPDGEVVDYDYDNAGNVSTVVSSTGGTLAGPITWNARNQPELMPLGNGVTTDPAYHASFDVLESVSVTGTSGAIYQQTYAYDHAVRVDQMTSSTHDEANLDFGYDALDRLLTVAPLGAATQSQTLTYSAIGNVLTDTKIGGGTFQYTSGKPHAIARAGSRWYAYDNNGNTTSVTTRTADCVTVERLMDWDATNRLRWVSANGELTSYRYDAGSQRIAKSGPAGTTYYFGTHIEVEDPDGAARLVKYYYLGDDLLARSESGTRLWYHLDHVGSVRAMSTSGGAGAVAYEYAAFGDTIETIGSADNLRGFGSHWRDDESHLVYMSARYQDPVIGRFTQPDTIVPDPGDPQSWNRYSYARNNPVNRMDPSGHQDVEPEERRRIQNGARGGARPPLRAPAAQPVPAQNAPADLPDSNPTKLEFNAPPPRTVPPTGRTGQALQCTANCTRLPSLLITGGQESTGHSEGSAHYDNNAVDIAGPLFNDLTDQQVVDCAGACGFTNGQFEEFEGKPNRDHWHVQIGEKKGVPKLPYLPSSLELGRDY